MSPGAFRRSIWALGRRIGASERSLGSSERQFFYGLREASLGPRSKDGASTRLLGTSRVSWGSGRSLGVT